ncbi:MAG: hypothetical protein M1821_006623 [Bathelium mastoideum]|nr:MAG: hypothetical protein M1821_006623 [Bathelium mastoideum]
MRQTGDVTAQAGEGTEFGNQSPRHNVVVSGYRVLSKLLRVNRESRDEVLNFYRVHVPCRFAAGATYDSKLSPGVLYFNPEYDILHISPKRPLQDTLVDFVYHLKVTYDLHHVGLLNLALERHDLQGDNISELVPSDLPFELEQAWIETFTQLHEVFFVSLPQSGRQIHGLLSSLPTSETIFNRSFPIAAQAPSFERLHRDPRSIADDLQRVYVGDHHPRDVVYSWRQLLKTWGISPTRVKYYFLLALCPIAKHQISDCRSAKDWLQLEDDSWNGVQKEGPFSGLKLPIAAQSEKYKNEDLTKAVKPAFGFWLFPVDELGALPEKELSEDRFSGFLDLTKHWPELALLDLP